MKTFIAIALSLAVLASLGKAEEQAPELAVVAPQLPQVEFTQLPSDEGSVRNKRQFGYGGYGGYGGGFGRGFGGGYGGYGGGFGRGFGGGYGGYGGYGYGR